MSLPVAYERAIDKKNILGNYADTIEEAFNLLLSGTLIYRGYNQVERVVAEMIATNPSELMSEEEYREYGNWFGETELTNLLLNAKRNFSLELERVIGSSEHLTLEEAMNEIDRQFLTYEEKYIVGINNVLKVISIGTRMKLVEMVNKRQER